MLFLKSSQHLLSNPHSPLYPNDDWKEEEQRKIKNFKTIDGEKTINKRTKKLIRQGILYDQKSKWWMLSTGGDKVLESTKSFWKDIKTKAKSFAYIENPFGVSIDFVHHIPERPRQKIVNFIQLVAHQNKHISYAPIMPRVCSLLLGFVKPMEAYAIIQAMINRSMEDRWYFSLTKEQFLFSSESVRELCIIKCRSVLSHFDAIQLDMAEIFIAFIFTVSLPISCIYTFFDAFLNEGKKVLYRFFIQFIVCEKTGLLKAKNKESVLKVFAEFCEKMKNIDFFRSYLEDAYDRSLSRSRHICPAEVIAQRRASTSISSIPKLADRLHNLFSEGNEMNRNLVGESRASDYLNGQSVLISQEDFSIIHSYLPRIIKSSKLSLCYRLSEDGTSFKSMIASAPSYTPIILLIKTTNGTFGAFLSDPPAKRDKNGRYFGRSSTFVFSLNPAIIYKKQNNFNNLFISIDENEMMVGGPKPAIYLMEGLQTMQSGDCETFESPSFCAPKGDMILDLELLGFQSRSGNHVGSLKI
ncbi:TLD family protein [Tritrichomonas foetus]|uniref:TLD family protein n=1 Tax=Tritrichomonas foetus TaxID=1144522 RepID=A0A1J4KT15_9EUKA|nr:TLD family protein [Tritrichomonas foetus]|eukprot:OHT14024.1 TLD family protein [Tritrichomonas foetus]